MRRRGFLLKPTPKPTLILFPAYRIWYLGLNTELESHDVFEQLQKILAGSFDGFGPDGLWPTYKDLSLQPTANLGQNIRLDARG